jgi:hypothetical protein
MSRAEMQAALANLFLAFMPWCLQDGKWRGASDGTDLTAQACAHLVLWGDVMWQNVAALFLMH